MKIGKPLVVLDLDAGTVRFANAGHNPSLWYRHTSVDVHTLDATGLLLGILPDSTYDEKEFAITPGDTLVLYTDGITEAQGEHGTMFGEARLQGLVQRTGRHTAGDIAKAIRQEVHTHAHGHLADDVTVLVLKIAAKAAGSVGES